MLTVIIPMLIVVISAMWRNCPGFKGNIDRGFLCAAIVAMLLGGVFTPTEWLAPWYKGMSGVFYVVWMLFFASVFSRLQADSGAIEGILRLLKALFGKSAKGMVLCVMVMMYVGGSIIGHAGAVSAVVGLMMIPILFEMKMSGEMIAATIVCSGTLGTIMPPLSNPFNFAASISGINVADILNEGYISVGICVAIVTIFWLQVYVGKKYSLSSENEAVANREKASDVLREVWPKLVPMLLLLIHIVISTVWKFDIIGEIIALIPFGESNLLEAFQQIPLIGSMLSLISQALLVGIFANIIINKKFRGMGLSKFAKYSLTNHKTTYHTMRVTIFAAFLTQSFWTAGQMDVIVTFAESLDSLLIKVGGGILLMICGMLIGAQSGTQMLLMPVLNAAWISAGVTPFSAATAGAFFATAGQGLPPADVTTFIVCGLTESVIKKKVNPMKSMLYCVPYCLTLAAVGLFYLFLR